MYFAVWRTKLWEASFSTVKRHPVTYRSETHGTATRLFLHLPSSSPSCSVACSTCKLLSLLTFLLERALQKSAIHGVIHVFILKPGAQHSLSLFLPLDYVCSIKCVFKSHVRGCGLKLASVTLQKGMALARDKNGQRSDPGSCGWVLRSGRQPRWNGPMLEALESSYLLQSPASFQPHLLQISNPQGLSPNTSRSKVFSFKFPSLSIFPLTPAQPDF